MARTRRLTLFTAVTALAVGGVSLCSSTFTTPMIAVSKKEPTSRPGDRDDSADFTFLETVNSWRNSMFNDVSELN
ncbi:hypothetical protein ACFWA6_29065 [Streptomyces sp. NPDC060020]|uniref:hypothetical protein n=1 Tax=Streptomyces sp. NPDC060020 TaxID=3347038 RepID=UPI00367E3451